MTHFQTGSHDSQVTASRAGLRLLAADRFWLWLFTGYFLLHIALRLASGGALGLDEAEILLDARQLDWGYGPQLPLYAWLQWAVFQITGPGILGLSVLKNGLLLATVCTLYLTIRTRQAPLMAGLAVLSLLTLYQFSWESQRALTHTVLANLCSVLSFAVIWRLIRAPSTGGYVLLGVVIAAGGLSKYNYAIALLAMVLAAVSDPETRKPFFSARLMLTVGIAALLLTPPMLWILNNRDLAFASAHKFDITNEGPAALIAAQGIAELAVAALSFVALLLVVLGLLWLIYRRQGAEMAADDLQHFMLRTVFWALVLLAAIVIASGSTNVKDRWLQPILIFAGPAIALWLLPRIGEVGMLRFAQFSALLAGLIGIAMLHHNLSGDAKRAAPFATLTPEVLGQTPAESAIVAHNWLAGNMVYFAPDRTIYNERGMLPSGPILRVWEADRKAPKDIDPANVMTVTAPYRFDDSKVMSLSFAPVTKEP
ncbi:hypothetical protein RKLH11_2047 [Rhodobacteraceae bacterium KLH11]|nr:hypothetical protein RKLH11_2047 [Rhodobacteraceae bacterium KLH11]